MIVGVDGANGAVQVPAAELIRPAALRIRCTDRANGVRECFAELERQGHVFRCYLYRRNGNGMHGGRIPCPPARPTPVA